MKLKVALAQLKIDSPNVADDIRIAGKFVEKAAKKGAGLIIFPEYILSDDPRRPGRDLKKLCKETKESLKTLQQFAKQYKIDIVSGSGIENTKGNFYNVTHYIDRKGKVLGKYRKINLFHPERPVLKSGDQPTVIQTRFGKIGLTICWDLISPELFREKIKRDAEIVICPSYWCVEDATKYGLRHSKTAEAALIDSISVARAFENNIIFIFVNAAGKSADGDTLVGHSQIAVPFKGAIAKLNHNRQKLLIKEINTSILDDAEKAYTVRADLGIIELQQSRSAAHRD
ncbi:carbon-nitrogen hydrolase family protein [Candidatus Gracilibacteria bacterium]|nr:carbon-nitrogen hydrolase family protein [Candidatus Gracilibacteria bacterium]